MLDIEDSGALMDYLTRTGRLSPGGESRIQNLAGGVSNRTVLVELPRGEAWVLKQALPKLRVASDWFSDPARVHREALGLRWLAELAPGSVPSLVFEDHAEHLLAMEAVPQPHENWKSQLLRGEVRLDLVRQFATQLATIHRRAVERRSEVQPVFADRSFFESLRLEPYYEFTATQVPEAAGFLRSLVAECRRESTTLVHGDYSPKNALEHAGRLVLLDLEVIHWGDPAFDVGFALTHFLSKAHHLPPQRSQFVEAAQSFWVSYAGIIDDLFAGLEARTVRHTLGCLLARVAGRSPLEYLDEAERHRQRQAVVSLMAAAPNDLATLIEDFGQRVAERG
jgi:aminoglycoside phosphotransferase (APT) family kinase protein